ncbi:MAG: 50S ribosomal protein L19e [Nanoarchaeota archaeon]
MNLQKKKSLAARTFKVGTSRVLFINSRLEEIKEAITKQDIRDLKKSGAIIIKEVKGRISKVKKKKKRSAGNVRKRINTRKKNYVILSKKLRKYVYEMKEQNRISKEDFKDLRKRIKNKVFKSKEHLKEYIKENKTGIVKKKGKRVK